MGAEDEAGAEEINSYKGTLNTVRTTTVPAARDAVYHGAGNPADSLLSDLASGGWVCPKATEFANTLRGRTGGIIQAFDDAIGVVNRAYTNEPDKVPKGDYRGNAWPKQWSMRNL